MTFAQAIKTCFRKYATFSGRASRPEYWWFMLFLLLGNVTAGILDAIFFGTVTNAPEVADPAAGLDAETTGPIGAVFGVATLLPYLAAGWRRMHDTGRSGLYLFYPLIVMIGIWIFVALFGGVSGAVLEGVFGIVMIVALVIATISPLLVIWWLTRPSEAGTNRYGPHPAKPADPEVFS